MNSACLRGNRNIAIINIMHLESAAFPRSSKHCTYIILFLLATCKGSKRQQWAIFRGKKKKTLCIEVHLGWTGTRPNHPSMVGKKLMSHIPSSTWLPFIFFWMPGREQLPLSETPVPTPLERDGSLSHSAAFRTSSWLGSPTSPWSCAVSWMSGRVQCLRLAFCRS